MPKYGPYGAAVGIANPEALDRLQAIIGSPSKRQAATAAIAWALEAIEAGGAVYETEALAVQMRRKTINAVVSNMETALRAFDKTANYSVVGDLATGNIEVTRSNSNHSRTLILVERRDAAKEASNDEYATNPAKA